MTDAMIDTGDVFHRHNGTAVVHETAQIPASTFICPGVYIGPNVTIGERCWIGPNAVIGCPGFGYEADFGELVYKEHPHGVVIGDDVHIGACACIDAGRWRATVIGNDTKIDNLVHVAHNVHIGERCLVIAHAEISGSVNVGDGAWVAPGASIIDNVNIGAGAKVGIGAAVIRDVPDGEVWAGVPARRLR